MKILLYHVSKIGALKARITHKVLGKNRHVGKKWAQNAPPLLWEDKKFPSLALLYDPPQLRWKFSRITYIGDRSFEGKNYTQVFWEKSTRTRQKMGSECTICIHFSKIFPGEGPLPAVLHADLVTPPPPPPPPPPGSEPSGSATVLTHFFFHSAHYGHIEYTVLCAIFCLNVTMAQGALPSQSLQMQCFRLQSICIGQQAKMLLKV